MIDVSVFSDNWPFRSLPETTLVSMGNYLSQHGISCALASSVRGIFHEDPQRVNRLLSWWYRKILKKRSMSLDFVPVCVLNPTLYDWQQNLQVCHEGYEAGAIKLHPNYHIYHLTDGAARELLTACGEAGLPVIVQMRMQDARSHHPLMQVPDVDINEVLEAAATTPQTQFVIGGIKWGEASGKANDINALPNVWLDISQCEIVDVLRRLIRLFGAKKLLFGTHAPFFYVKSALLKLEEARLTEEERELITERNARELFKLE